MKKAQKKLLSKLEAVVQRCDKKYIKGEKPTLEQLTKDVSSLKKVIKKIIKAQASDAGINHAVDKKEAFKVFSEWFVGQFKVWER